MNGDSWEGRRGGLRSLRPGPPSGEAASPKLVCPPVRRAHCLVRTAPRGRAHWQPALMALLLWWEAAAVTEGMHVPGRQGSGSCHSGHNERALAVAQPQCVHS